MKIKNRFTLRDLSLLFGFLIVLSASSCDKNDSTELEPQVEPVGRTTAATLISNTNLLWQSTFETTTDFNQWYFESPLSTSITRSTSPVKNGSYAAKFVLNKTDPSIWDSKRAEVTYNAEKNGPCKSERWYGLSFFLPTSYIADPCSEILFQWKGVSKTSLDGYSMSNPPISFLTSNGRFKLNIKYAATMNSVDLGPYSTNAWTDLVMHIKFSYEDDGLIQIWKNGTLILDRKGPNTFKDVVGNFFKMGIYKFGWAEGYVSNTTQRTVYFDEVRVGNENSSFNEVAPRSASGTVEPAPAPAPTPTPTPTPSPLPTASNVVFAVNAGGSAFTASNGITYQADTKFVGGGKFQTTAAIANTTDDVLYQSERYGNFNYNIPVANGTYEITFKLAEIYFSKSGARVFDILTEGQQVVGNLDIFQTAGFRSKLDIVKTVTVTDGVLNIQTRGDVNNAKLSAFHIIKK